MTKKSPRLVNPTKVDGFSVGLGKTTAGNQAILNISIYIADNYRFPVITVDVNFADKQIYCVSIPHPLKRVKQIINGETDIIFSCIEALSIDKENPELKDAKPTIEYTLSFLKFHKESEFKNNSFMILFNQTFIDFSQRVFDRRMTSVRRVIRFHKEPFKLIKSFIYKEHDHGPLTSFDVVKSGDSNLPWVCCIVEIDHLVNREFDILLTEEDFALMADETLTGNELCLGKALGISKMIYGEESVPSKTIETFYNAFFESGFDNENGTNKNATKEIVNEYLGMKK
ncbi:hypothetical protein [Klebsiella phage YC1]|nr:hypothetical protein [Klebsiella phage YC1]